MFPRVSFKSHPVLVVVGRSCASRNERDIIYSATVASCVLQIISSAVLLVLRPTACVLLLSVNLINVCVSARTNGEISIKKRPCVVMRLVSTMLSLAFVVDVFRVYLV